MADNAEQCLSAAHHAFFSRQLRGARQYRPAGYHWVNLVLHWGNAVLLYMLVLRLGAAMLPAAFAALLFAVHPIATEAVTNMIGRADLLATMAVLGGLLLHIRSQAATRKWCWRLAFLLTATVGIFCKENTATLLGIIALYDVLFRLGAEDTASMRATAKSIARFAVEGWVLLLPPLALMWGARSWLAHGAGPQTLNFTDNLLVTTDFLTARLTAIKTMGQQLGQMLWPARLCWDYAVEETRLFGWDLGRWPDQQALLALLALAAIALLAVALWRRARGVVFFVGFFFITLLPTSNLIVLIYSARADRFLYLPSVGLAGCVAFASAALTAALDHRCASDARRRPIWATVLVYGLLSAGSVALAARTHVRNRDWRNELTICTHDTQSCPDSFRIRRCLANGLFYSDRRRNIDAAIANAEVAQAILERAAPAGASVVGAVLEDLGLYYATKADLSSASERSVWDVKAVAALERATAAQQALSAAYADSERRRGRPAEDIPEVGSSTMYSTYLTLGQTYLQVKEPAKALEPLRHASRLAPANANVYVALSAAYSASGEAQSAIRSLLQASLCDQTRQDIWPRLFALYQQVDPGGCAFVRTAGQYQFNHDCPIVHRDICAALEGQADGFIAAGDSAGARNVRAAAVTLHGCPAPAGPRS